MKCRSKSESKSEESKKRRRATPQKRGATWEKQVYDGICKYLQQFPTGYAHHMLQPRFGHQVIDILVDGLGGRNYGIECKSTEQVKSYPAKWFDSGQYEEETKFLIRSGREGFIAFRMPRQKGAGRKSIYGAYLIPWDVYPKLCGSAVTAELLDENAEILRLDINTYLYNK